MTDAPRGHFERRVQGDLAEDLARFIVSFTRGENAWARISPEAKDIYRSGAARFVAAAVLPLVERYAAAKAAEELEDAAHSYREEWPGINRLVLNLHARAAALRAGEDGQPDTYVNGGDYPSAAVVQTNSAGHERVIRP